MLVQKPHPQNVCPFKRNWRALISRMPKLKPRWFWWSKSDLWRYFQNKLYIGCLNFMDDIRPIQNKTVYIGFPQWWLIDIRVRSRWCFDQLQTFCWNFHLWMGSTKTRWYFVLARGCLGVEVSRAGQVKEAVSTGQAYIFWKPCKRRGSKCYQQPLCSWHPSQPTQCPRKERIQH